MKKLPYIVLSLSLLVFLLFPTDALAVTLSSIGGLNTSNNTYTEWWYTGNNPVLAGTSTANGTVTVTVDSVASTVTADASGNWTYQTSMTTGNSYEVVLSDTAGTYSFTLHIGEMDSTTNTSTNSATPSATNLPVTGFGAPTIALLATAGLLITTPFIAKRYL